MDRKIHDLCLSARNVLNWLILFLDFPGDQIKAAGEITSNNLTDITIPLSHVGRQKERARERKNILALCLPGALCLIALLLLMKCWCNYKKEAFLLFLLMRIMLVSALTGVMESQNTHCTSAPFHSNTFSLSVPCLSPPFLPPPSSVTLSDTIQKHKFVCSLVKGRFWGSVIICLFQ